MQRFLALLYRTSCFYPSASVFGGQCLRAIGKYHIEIAADAYKLVLNDAVVGCIMDGIHIFDQLDTKITALLDDVCQALEDSSGGDDASAFLSGALLILLSSLGKGVVSAPHTSKHMLITSAVSYIDKNLSKDLNVKIVADAMKVSQSTLSHTFKSEMGISLHKYIIEKRMILAKRLIDGGGSPTKIFSDLGFSDYSSFYKAFVTYFGYSPSGKGI